jgi:hypothetical protein
VLLHTGWLREEPAKIEPSGKITVLAPSEPVVCNRRRALGHGQEVVAETQALGDPDGFAFRTPALAVGRFRIASLANVLSPSSYTFGQSTANRIALLSALLTCGLRASCSGSTISGMAHVHDKHCYAASRAGFYCYKKACQYDQLIWLICQHRRCRCRD